MQILLQATSHKSVALLAGYWAYGNEVSANLTDSLSGPAWAKALAYMAAFFQILVSLHVS